MSWDGKKRRRSAAQLTADYWEAARREAVADMVALGTPPAEAEAEAAKWMERARLRVAWASERFGQFLEMQERAGQAYERRIDAHPEIDWEADDAPDLPEPPEEAVAQAIYDEVMAALNHDRWPRHLHFRDV